MNRFYVIMILIVCLTGCGSNIVQGNSDNAVVTSRVYIKSITLQSEINRFEEGVAIFIESHGKTASGKEIDGISVRIPRNGNVLVMNSGESHVFGSVVGIPNVPGPIVDIFMVAVPNGISMEAMDALAFAVNKAAGVVGPLPLILEYAADKVIGNAKDELQKGRVLGSLRISAEELAQHVVHELGGFSITTFVDKSAEIPLAAQKLVMEDGVRLRSEPGLSSPIITKLAKGSKVTLLGQSEIESDQYVWTRIRSTTGHEGWIARSYLSDIDAPVEHAAANQSPPTNVSDVCGTARVVGDISALAIRAQTSRQSSQLAAVNVGRTVDLLCVEPVAADERVWRRVRWAGIEGWMSTRYLAIIEER